jgi:flagellar basal-body rod protein FlgF
VDDHREWLKNLGLQLEAMFKKMPPVPKWHFFVILEHRPSSNPSEYKGFLAERGLRCESTESVMDPLTISAASGIKARMEALDMLANNIANASTSGFKLDRESYNVYFAAESQAGEEPSASTSASPLVEKNWTDFSQGNLVQTGNGLDLALEGRGFFVVDGPNGALFTRNGAFRISRSGLLETAEGHPVRIITPDGKPYKLDPLLPVQISPDGSISQGSAGVGRIATADFDRPASLSKAGGAYFQVRNPVSQLATAHADIRQGSLESANVVPSENAVRLVSVMRQFETLQRAMSIGAEMNRRAVDEVAKVNS